MRVIPYFSFGTYYTKYAIDPGENAAEIKNLAYWAKGKWSGSDVILQHPWLRDGEPWQVRSTKEACTYVAELIAHNMDDICEYLEIPEDSAIEWVPVPSSSLVRANMHTARCCGREIGSLLERQHGIGTVSMLVVNKTPMPSKLDGNREPEYEDFLQNYEVVAAPDPDAYQIYLDDIVTWGKHVAALDAALEHPVGASLLTIGRTDKANRNAYEVRSGELRVKTFMRRLLVEVT